MIRRVQVRRRAVPDFALPGVHPLVSRVLAARGLDAPPDYSLARLLPPEMGGLDEACRILVEALDADDRIIVVGDFDADGATGTALAVRGLQAMGYKSVGWLVPDRVRHGYGLSRELVAGIEAPLPAVLVTVDQGVTSHGGIALARERGMRVIVTDHHLPGPSLPPADAMVNPNLPGESFASDALAGVGVMFYLLMALRSRLREAGRFAPGREPRLDEWLDLVALGTVADLVPLDDNNRRLVYQGLARIRAGRCTPGVRALLEIAGRNLRHVEAPDLGFVAAPRLNAAGRLDDMGIGVRCLLSERDDQARELAAELDRLNRDRQAIQADMQADAEAIAGKLLDRIDGDLPGLCLYQPDWHAGVVGLVSGRLMERLQRPVIAFAPVESGAEELKGSGRGPAGFHMRDFLVEIDTRQPELMGKFGGHARAAGLSLPRRNLRQFQEIFNKILKNKEFNDEKLLTDGELESDWFSTEAAAALAAAGPWGQAWPEPLFDGRFSVVERRVVGERHLKMKLRAQGGGPVVDAIAFGAGSLCHQDLPEPLHLAYSLEINRWQGRVSPQLRVRYLVESVHG